MRQTRQSARRLYLVGVLLILVVPGLDCKVPSAENSRPPVAVAVWPAGPLEVVAAFPAPLRPEQARDLVGRAISYRLGSAPAVGKPGEHARDKPGKHARERSLQIAGARLMDGGRTLILATDPHPAPARYRLASGEGPDAGPALCYDLAGVEALWSQDHAAEGDAAEKAWLPLLDLKSLDSLSRSSPPHGRLRAFLARPGRLTLGSLVVLPPGDHTVRVECSRPVEEVILGDHVADVENPGEAPGYLDLEIQSRGEPQFFSAAVPTGSEGPPLTFRVLVRSAENQEFLPIAADRLLLPWAPTPRSPAEPAAAEAPDPSGGDPRRGEALFFGETGRCSQCHTFQGRGAAIGPDLTQIAQKGWGHLYRSIVAPSAEMDPDYMPYTVAARDGRVFAGLVRAEGADAIRVIDNAAKLTTLGRVEIDQIRPSGTSIMPVGLAGALGADRLRDLAAFLLTPPSR